MTNKQPLQPNWWPHSTTCWNEVSYYFSTAEISVQAISQQTNWKRLSKGQTNQNYRLKCANKQYFVQIICRKSSQLQPTTNFVQLNSLLRNHTALNHWLVACHFESSHSKIDEWYESNEPINQDFEQTDFIDSLVEFLVTLHSGDAFLSVDRQRLPAIDIEEYLARYRRLALENEPQNKSKIEALYNRSAPLMVQFCSDAFCHNDLSSQNLLWSKQNGLKIIDWEYAGWGDRTMDLANLILCCRLSPTQETLLLNNYNHKAFKIISLDKLETMKELASIITELWFLAREKS